MTADDFLTLLLAITIILLGVATMADYIRYRDGMRRDIALAFAPLTVLVIGGILADIFHTPWFEGLGVLFLVAHPYLMLRLVVYFRQVPKNIIRFALFGMVYTGVMYLLYVDDPPPIPALVAVSYFFGIDGYSMFAFIRGAMTAPGIVTRRRLRLAAVGAGLLALTPWLTPLIGTIALISFYVGFAPPRGLRRMWQWKELERLLLLLSSRTDAQTKDGVYRNLIQTATEAVGGSKTVFLLWQTSADDWMLIGDESNERPQTIALDNENIIQQVWQTRTPISVKAQEVLIEKNAHDESASIALIVPLARGERKWGLLLTFLQHGSLFPEDDLNLLGIFAEQSAIVLENVELLDETRQHARQLEGLVSQRTQALRQQNMYVILLQQIAVTANESTTIDSALQRAIDLICEHIKFPVGHAFAPSGTDSKTLVSQSVWRLDHSDTFEPFRKATHDMTFSSDLGVIGEVMAEGKPKLITNLTEDTNFIRREAAKAANLHSGLFVPVFSGETVVAVLEFLSDLYIVPDESLLEVMVHIGAQLGRVIERTQAQEALHESEARLAGMIESAMDAIITIDEDQRVLLFNRAAEEMFQYPSEEMLNGPLERLIPEEFRARHHQHIHKFGATGVTNRQMGALDAIRGLRANGDEFPIEASISQVEIRGHKYFTVILRDITERKLADEALRESEERQRMVNELISDYAFSTIVNADGSYGMDWLTGSFTRVTGYDFNDRERFKDNPSIYHPDDQQQVLDDIERVKQCETVTGEYRIVKPDGKIRWLEITRRPVWDDAEGRVVKFFGAAQDITERKKAEDALKESEGRYRLLAENSSDMISLHEPEGEFVYVSPAIEKLLGYKADEMIGVNPYTLFHPDDIERIRIESHDRALEGVTLNRVEYRMKTAKGDYTWLESATQPIIEDGKVVGLVSVTGDINERKHAEATLRDSESRLGGIIQSAMDAIITVDEDQCILLFNPTAEKMFQYTAAEVMGLSLDRLVPERFHEQHRTHIEKFGNTGVSNREMGALTPISGLRANGEEFPIEASISQVTVGKNRYFTVILRDITERQRAEAAIQDSENRFRSTFEQAAVGISHVSIDGAFIRVNQRFCEIVGYTHTELFQLTFQEITHPGDLQSDLQYNQQLLDMQIKRFSLEKRYIRQDGSTIWCNMTVSLVYDDDDNPLYFIKVIEDISERKQLESDLRQLNEELETRVEERTAHLSAVNQELEAFSYSVSHDLRAPLRSIDGFSQALLEDYTDKVDAGGQDYLNRIRAGSQRMGQLIDDMIELSQINRGDIQYDSVNLSQLAQDVIASLQERNPGRDIAISIQDEMVTRGDARLLRILLENLLGNAWKFTSKATNARIEFGHTTHDGEPAYYVRDNGAGFDMKYADKLFGAFQRLHSAADFEGTGIGLATCKRVVHRHGGSLWAEAEVGKGAAFYFTL